MGGKRTGTGKHLYGLLACLIVLLPAACAPLGNWPGGSDAYGHLRRIEPLMAQHDFDGALREGQEVLALSPKGPPADEALFDMALVHVHFANPRKDHRKAAGLFSRVVKEFPDSPRVEEAKIWMGVLEAIEKARQVDADIEERKKVMVK
jgi:TolA-binding protein